MCLRLGTKPPTELITQYLWNLLCFIPVRMGTTVRITGSAIWSHQNWVCFLRSAFPVGSPLSGPRCQHLKKIIMPSEKSCISEQQSIHTNPYLPLHLLLFQPEFRLESSRRYIWKGHHAEFCISPFPTMLCLLPLHQMCSQRASTTNLSQLGQFSVSRVNCLIPDFVRWWLPDPTVCDLPHV